MATLAVLAASLLALSHGCSASVDVRIENASALDFADVSVAGTSYGKVAAGAASDFRSVVLRSRYAVVELVADGHEITGQTLGAGSSRFTCRVDVLDAREGRLSIEVVPET